MKLTWLRFGGLRPRLAPRLLPDDYAQVAHNTLLVDGTIRPLESDALRLDDAGMKTVYRAHDAGGKCGGLVAFDHCVDVLPTPAPGCCGDLEAYVLWHHNGEEPEWWLPARNLRGPLIVPAPRTRIELRRLTMTRLDTPPDKSLIYVGPDQRVYTYTWVDQFGVESRPAPPSVAVQAWDDEHWELSGFDAPPPNAIAMRIYRTAPSFDDGSKVNNPLDTSFQLLVELEPPFPTTFVDDIRGKDIETGTLLTFEDSPVPDGMQQVVVTESGYFVGFRGNDLFVSERFEPWNWPSRYRHNLPDRIVRLVANEEWVYVITTGRPYRMRPQFLIQDEGTDLEAHLQPYPDAWPGMGHLAACEVPWGAAYVTRHGIVVLSPQQAQLVTAARMGIDDWDRWAPNIMAWYRGKLVCFRSPAGQGFMFDLPRHGDELEPGDLVTIDNPGVQALHGGDDGLLYYANDNGVYAWRMGDGSRPWRWRSKIVRLPSWMRFSTARVCCSGNGVVFRLFMDGKLVHEQEMMATTVFRLPQHPKGHELEIELESRGHALVWRVDLATSKGELVGK